MTSEPRLEALRADVDTLRDVYMSRAQREAYERIMTAALDRFVTEALATPGAPTEPFAEWGDAIKRRITPTVTPGAGPVERADCGACHKPIGCKVGKCANGSDNTPASFAADFAAIASDLAAKQEPMGRAFDEVLSRNLVDFLEPAPVAVESDAVANALRRVLEWPLPHGTVESYSLPGWLAKEARDALATPQAAAQVSELVAAAKEVHRISERDHEAWHRLTAAIAALRPSDRAGEV